MLRRILVLICLWTAVYGAGPRPLPEVPIQTPDKKKISLRQFRGKVVLLVLISTTCADCIKTIDILNRMQKDFGARGLQVVVAGVNENAPFEIGPFVQRYRPAYPVGYLDREGTIKMAAVPKDVRPFVPIAMFIDRKGMVQLQYFGDDPIFKEEEKAFRAIMNSFLNFGQEKR